MVAKYKTGLIWVALIFAVSFSVPSLAQTSSVEGTQTSENASSDDPAPGDAAKLAEQLSNPISSLISVPFQFNYDSGLGQTDADRWLLNIQPVVPFDLSEDWETQHPLAHGLPGQYFDQQGRALGHAPRPTARAKSTALTTEGDQVLSVAGRAALPQKAVFQPAAFEVVLEFTLYIARQSPAPLC
jgi:hypothetical protein